MTIYNVHDEGATIELAEQDTSQAIYLDEWDNGNVLVTIEGRKEDGYPRVAQSVVDLAILRDAVDHFILRETFRDARG